MRWPGSSTARSASARRSACRCQSRLIDRFGQRRVLLPAAVLDATATVALIALTEGGAPTAALVACGLLGGVAIPAVGGALRALWPELLRGRDDLTGAAFALDSVALELLFTSGPLIAALVVAVASPVAALVLSAVCSLAGTVLFVAQAPSRGWRPDRGAPRGRRARRAALERRAHARLRRAAGRLRLRHRRDQPAGLRRGARQRASSPGSCSRPGRWAASRAASPTARASGRARSARSTSRCRRRSRSGSSPPCSPARSARWRVLVVPAGPPDRAAGGGLQRADRARRARAAR